MPYVRHAVRKLLRNPGFAFFAVLTLAIGIGASAAIFSLVDAILLSPLPYSQAERLVEVLHDAPKLELDGIGQSDAIYLRYRDHGRVFDGIALYDSETATLTGGGEPERLEALVVTASLFSVLRVPPALGRNLVREDERPGAPPVVVLADELWRGRFGAAPDVVGETLEIDGVGREVVGVMPPGFAFPRRGVELWLPMTIDPAATQLGAFGPDSVARLSPGVTLEGAEADLNRLVADLEEVFPEQSAAPLLAEAGFAVRVRPFRDAVVGDVEDTLWILFATVALVLVIACANVANLVLVRAEGERRDTAVRIAIGATRWRLAAGALAESLLVTALAGLAGLALAQVIVRFVTRFGPRIPRLDEVAVDARTAVFAAAVALAAGLVFGWIPVLRSGFEALGARLKEGRAMTPSRRRARVRHLLVGAQVALALVLMIASGLMVRSFTNLAEVDPGFREENVLTAAVSLPESRYPDDAAAARFIQEIVDRVAGLPGVEAAGATSALPLGGEFHASGHSIEDEPLDPGELPPVIENNQVTAGYFESMGIPLREGRLFEPADSERRSPVAIVSATLARDYWPNESAVGKRLAPETSWDEGEDPWYTIVGVVGDVANPNLVEDLPSTIYYPLLAKEENDWIARRMTLTVKTHGEPTALTNALRREVWALDADLPIARVRTLEDVLRNAKASMAFTVVLLLFAGAVALLLTAVGTFGVVSFLVSQRTAEIGLRMALGARQRDVRGMVLRQGFLLGGLGVGFGTAVAAVGTRWLEAILFGVDPLDPLTFVSIPFVVLGVALFACWLPAERAAETDPVVALRHE